MRTKERGDDVFTPRNFVSSQESLKRWLLDWFGSACEDDESVMIMMLYHMWLARNATRDGKAVEDARSLVERV